MTQTTHKSTVRRILIICLSLTWGALCSQWAFANADETSLKFERCLVSVDAVQIDAECATLTRHENPQDSASRLLDLSVIKLPARTPKPEPDAFTLIQGGPGGSSIDLTVMMRQAIEGIRTKRDILVIDQRGTGRSNKLSCAADYENMSLQITPDEVKKIARDCLASFNEADLRYYTTSAAVDDLEALRKASGYSQLNLYGVSYGTRVAQHYLRKHPDSIRSVIIDGVASIGLSLAGGEVAVRSQQAFDALTERCNQSIECKQQFGNIKHKFAELRARFKVSAIKIETPHPNTGKLVETELTEDNLLDAVRMMPYTTEQAALVPLMIAQAHDGDYRMLAASSILAKEQRMDALAIGMHNSVVCTEDAPFVTEQSRNAAQSTYFGNTVSDLLLAACEVWPKGRLDENFHRPFDSDKPVLILSGEFDPITPPDNGEFAQNMFSNSHHLVVPGHGHGVLPRGCIPKLVSNFVEHPTFDEIDASCIERERALPLFTSHTGPKP